MADNFFLLSQDSGAPFSLAVSGNDLVVFAATYWLHSTLLIGAAWLLLRLTKPDSHFVRERVWKLAAVAGFATACVQLVTGLGVSLLAESKADLDSPKTKPLVSVSIRTGDRLGSKPSGMTADEARRTVTTSLQMVRDSIQKLGDVPETLAVSKSEISSERGEAAVPLAVVDPATLTTVSFLPVEESLEVPGENRTAVFVPTIAAVDLSRATGETSSVEAEDLLSEVAGPVAVGWFSLSLICLAWQSVQFRWQMRHVQVAAPSHRKLLDSLCNSHGTRRRVRLLKSDSFEEPVAYGLLRPTILIPTQVERRLNREELVALLSHELAHLTRGDIVWLVVGRVLATCFAFQPLNFLARRRWQQHAEFQCDDWAVARNVDRLTLARSLTLVAEWRSERNRCVVSAGGSRCHISDRVERLLADAVPDRWRCGSRRLVLHLVAFFAAGAVVVFGPQTGNAERADEQEGIGPGRAGALRTGEDSAPVEEASLPGFPADEESEAAVSKKLLSELIREVDGLTGDVSDLLAELRTLEPLLARLERQSELTDKVAQLRIRIGLLKKLARSRAQPEIAKEAIAKESIVIEEPDRDSEENRATRGVR